ALAAILMVASGMGDLWRGALLLMVYGLSMTLPFVVAALFAGPFLGFFARHRAAMGHVEKAMGVMLIVFGLMIATNTVNLIAEWMISTFDWSATLR
ncbi:MAG: cytochrome c biogenesis protein CcdA, partial [Gemmobacter sp.]